MTDVTIVQTQVISQTLENIQIITQGIQGPAGTGLITGGTIGQSLTKNSSTNFDANWVSLGETPSTSSVLNFLSYSPASQDTTVDCTVVLQNFLLQCQLIAYQLKNSSLDDQDQRNFVTAYLPRGYYNVSCPIIIPELVNLKCDGILVRNGSAGTITSNYTGNTSSQALANLYQPTLIIVPKGHCENVCIYSNTDGVHKGAGMFVGKNWTVQSFAVGARGSGYHVSDVLTCAQPSLSPYIAATATVSSVNGSGAITGISVTNGGAYALPSVLQAQQWTTANGFSVFDSNGHFLTTGGNGTGATLSPTWIPDWTSPTTTYYNGTSGLITDTILGRIRIEQIPTTFDSTYGAMNAFTLFGLNTTIDEIELQGGLNGINFNFASDVRANKLNCVGSTNGIVIFGGSNIVCSNVVIDTPGLGSVLIDNVQGVKLSGRMFNRNVYNYAGSNNYTVSLGLNSSSMNNIAGVELDFQMTNMGSGTTGVITAGNPALYLAYVEGSSINLNITNYTSVSPPAPITSFAYFGSNVDTSINITGSIDNVSGSMFAGSIPACGIRVWNGSTSTYIGQGSSSIPILSGTFSSRPSAKTALQYFATDLGTAGVLLISNGTVWKPATGSAVIVCDPTLYSAAGTGSEANIVTKIIPAGLLSANGALRITAQMNCTGTNGGKTIIWRFSATSGGTNGTQVLSAAFGGSSTTLSASAIKTIQNNASVSSQILTNTGMGTYGTASSTGLITTAINTANVSYINFNINGNSSDTIGYQGIFIEWLEP